MMRAPFPADRRGARRLGSLLCALALGAAALPVAADEPTRSACGDAPSGWFLDVSGEHQPGIDCLAWRGIAEGKDPLTYAPEEEVTRGQMAPLIARAMRSFDGLGSDGNVGGFTDAAGSVHEDAIDALAAIGVVRGTSDGTYGPGLPVTRAQMASFLVRAWKVVATDLPSPTTDPFPDIDTSVHAEAIRKMAEVGWTRGRADGTYDPVGTVTRAEMATFLARCLSSAVDAGLLDEQPPTLREPFEVPVGLRWTRVEHEPGVVDGPGADRMYSVVPFGDGLVAVGQNWNTARARAWSSEDGQVWQRHERPFEVFSGLGRPAMLDVAVAGPGLVAVGREPGHAAVWTSVDGRQWERLPHDDRLFAAPQVGVRGPQSMMAVTAGDRGIVAVGHDGQNARGVVWTSTNGIDWERHSGDGLAGGTMLDVVEGGPGLISVGSIDDAAAVWASEDATEWTSIELPSGPDGGLAREIRAITAYGDGFVAVGLGEPFTPIVWWSPDGLAWTQVVDERGVLEKVTLNDVTQVDDIVVAVGRDEAAARGGIWISADGAHWHAVDDADATFADRGLEELRAVTVWGDRLVAVGGREDEAVVLTAP